ncbi:MAG: nucleotide-binding protein [Dehalococcoidales bacterium]|nr:nucleotide-binding protein [Dehalococcoidales bacterium]
MPKILIIDDDAALEMLAENLRLRGYEVQRYSSASQALKSLDDVLKNELIILDILMDIPKSETVQITSGIRAVGMHIYRQIRSKNKNIPIVVYSGCNDADLVEIVKDDPHSTFLSKWRMPTSKEIVSIIENILGLKQSSVSGNIFIVHGHNDKLKLELKNYLQNVLDLPEPIILHEQANVGRTIIEKFEDYAYCSNLVFVILTPDDKVAGTDSNNDEKRRARQNVIFEMGFFMGILGRETGRVILLHAGLLELPNDLSGVVYIDVSKGIEASGEEIRRELKSVNRQSSSW